MPKTAAIDVIITDNAKFIKHNIKDFDFSKVHYDFDLKKFRGFVSFHCEKDVVVYPDDRFCFDIFHYDSFGDDYGFKLELGKDNELLELEKQVKRNEMFLLAVAGSIIGFILERFL